MLIFFRFCSIIEKDHEGGILMKIKRIGIIVSAIVLLLGARVSFSEPGSDSDPLLSLSYLEKEIDKLKYYIDEKLDNKLEEKPEKPREENSWKVVEVEAGKSLICKDGTEIILRSGKGEAISKITTIFINGVEEVIDNGLTDVTQGKDLTMGSDIPRDHLLIIPRDDGRGVNCTSNSFFLVKGEYKIK